MSDGGGNNRVRYCSSCCLYPYPGAGTLDLGVARLAPVVELIMGFMGLVDAAALVGIPVLTLVVVSWIAVTGDFTWMGRWIAPMG